MSVPNGPINKKYTYFQRSLILLQTTAPPKKFQVLVESGGFWGHSKHILGSFGDFEMTLRLRWAYEGYLGIILSDFRKIFTSPSDFNDFI